MMFEFQSTTLAPNYNCPNCSRRLDIAPFGSTWQHWTCLSVIHVIDSGEE